MIMPASAAFPERPPMVAPDVRLGSFMIGRRLSDEAAGGSGIVVLEGSGAPDSSFAGRTAIVRCLPPNTINAGEGSRAKTAFARLRGLQNPAIAPILEAGIANGTTFIAEAQPVGSRLANRIAASGKLLPVQVRRLVADVAGALSAMHGVELTHGWVSPQTVWVKNDGAATISGFVGGCCGSLSGSGGTLSGQNASEDQLLLAQTAFAALTGSAFRLNPRVPDTVPGIPTGVVSVLARATATRSADRFPNVAAFAQAFDTAMTHASEDLIAGVWEATGRGDLAMGKIMIEMAEGFAPGHPDLPLLRLRVNGETGVGQIGSVPQAAMDVTFGQSALFDSASALSGARSQDEKDAIAALLTLPKHEPKTSKSSPWIGFMAGTFVCVLLLVVAAAFTLIYM
jgi:hypothetical protein